MSANFKRRLPIPQDLKKEMPLSDESAERKKAVDAEVASIIRGESDKKLIIVGPCSADNEDAVLDYASRLAVLQQCVQDKLVIVMRVYTNKPRTNGTGYKGRASRPSATCTCASSRRRASSRLTRCSTRRMTAS